MELPPRAGGYRQSRRSRSQRDRERKMTGAGGRDPRPYSPSSGSDPEAGEAPCSSRPRPPRRRRRESTSCEEDIIDGFAIASFPTLEALEDAAPKPAERADSQRKRQEKRKPEENQPGSPCEGPRGAESSEREQNRHNGERNPPPTKKVKTKGPSRGNESTGGENGSSQRSSSRGTGSDVSAHSSLGTGYFCDIDSDPDDKAVGDEALCSRRLDYTSAQDKSLHSVWQRISFQAGSDDGLSNFFTAATKIGSDVNGAVIPKGETKVSGLERSQERNQVSDKDPLLVPSLPAEVAPQAAPAAPAAASSSAQAPEGPQAQPEVAASAPARSRTPVLPSLSNHHHHHHHHQHHHNPQQQQHRQSAPARVNPQAKPQTLVHSQPKVHQQQLVYLSRSSTPSKTLTSASQLPHRASTPSSLASHGFVPALRPSSHPAHPHPGMFAPSPGLPPPPPLTSTMLQVAGHPSPAAVAAFSEQELIRQELNSRYLSSQGSERGATLGPASFQFHQHQHTHQHTHQHFAPFPTIPQPSLVPAPAPSMHFQGYHTPVSGIPSVLPPAGSFGSVQGAFQPKTPNPELTPRSGPETHTLLQKDPRLTEAYRPTIRKPGKWCAMHVHIAWMIYRHQEKNKMIQSEHHKLDFAKTDLLSRNPSSLFGPVTHEMPRSATLFAAADPGHTASSPFVSPNALNVFLSPSPHLDPYGRTPAYSAIGQLTNRAFGGLGNPAVAVSTVFPHKDNAAAQSLGHSRDHWNRLHQTPPSFPTPPPAWPRLAEVERERGSLLDKELDSDKHEFAFIKEEKEREAAYGRHQIRASPTAHRAGHAAAVPTAALDEERGRPRSSGGEPRGASREPPREQFKQEQQQQQPPPAARRPGEDGGGREPSPYGRTGAEGPRPGLLRELARRHEVRVKEERKEEPDVVPAPPLPGFEGAHLPPGALHPLPVPLAMVGQLNGLGMLERGRLLSGPYLGGVGHPGGWEPWRGPEAAAAAAHPLPSRYPAAQPRYLEAYRERALLREMVPEALLAQARREQEAGAFLEAPPSPQLLLPEEYEQRARLLGYLGPHPHHPAYPRVSPSLVHHPGAGLLSKTPPMATLGAPPPLISSSTGGGGGGGGGRPGSPIPRAAPLSASELHDLATYAQKDRDSR